MSPSPVPDLTVTDLVRMVVAATQLGPADLHHHDEAGDPAWEWSRPGKRFGVCFGRRAGDTGWYYAHKHPSGIAGGSGPLTDVSDLDQIAIDCGFFVNEPAEPPKPEIVTTAKQRWAAGFQKRVALIRRLLGISD